MLTPPDRAWQVQRLLQRDRKELMGVEEIGAGFSAEFDDGKESEAEARGSGNASANGASPSSSAPASPFGTGVPSFQLSCLLGSLCAALLLLASFCGTSTRTGLNVCKVSCGW